MATSVEKAEMERFLTTMEREVRGLKAALADLREALQESGRIPQEVKG